MPRKAGSRSAGYHYDATPKNPAPTRTPTKAPKPSQAAKGPAGDYKGAAADYEAAVVALPAKAQVVTEKATARASRKRTQAKRQRKRALALTKDTKAKKASQRVKTPVLKQAKAKKIQVRAPKTKPVTFEGKKTAGTPTLGELRQAKKQDTLKVNKKGVLTTPKIRVAARRVKKAKKAIAKGGASKGPLPGLGPEETKVAKAVLRTGEKLGATKKELLAAAETGLVESGFKNYTDQGETDADSLGWRQERTSIYGADATKPKKGARNFFSETKEQSGSTAGELAANVQRPAEEYRGRYDEEKPKAVALLSAYKRGKATPKQRQELKAAKAQAKKVGLKVGKKDSGSYPAMKAKRLKGAWGGSRAAVMSVVKGLPWGSGKRTPAENAAVGGATESDHLTTNKLAFAADLGPGSDVAATVAKRLKLNGWAPGTYERFTSPKFPGYSFQILWEVDGHYDHVHVGAEWTGEDLPAGTYEGGAGIGGSSAGGLGVSGGAVAQYAAATGLSKKQAQAKLKKKETTPGEIFKKLKSLGVGQEAPTTQTKEPTSELARLEKKYAAA